MGNRKRVGVSMETGGYERKFTEEHLEKLEVIIIKLEILGYKIETTETSDVFLRVFNGRKYCGFINKELLDVQVNVLSHFVANNNFIHGAKYEEINGKTKYVKKLYSRLSRENLAKDLNVITFDIPWLSIGNGEKSPRESLVVLAITKDNLYAINVEGKRREFNLPSSGNNVRIEQADFHTRCKHGKNSMYYISEVGKYNRKVLIDDQLNMY